MDLCPLNYIFSEVEVCGRVGLRLALFIFKPLMVIANAVFKLSFGIQSDSSIENFITALKLKKKELFHLRFYYFLLYIIEIFSGRGRKE